MTEVSPNNLLPDTKYSVYKRASPAYGTSEKYSGEGEYTGTMTQSIIPIPIFKNFVNAKGEAVPQNLPLAPSAYKFVSTGPAAPAVSVREAPPSMGGRKSRRRKTRKGKSKRRSISARR